ncbi:hypothetical protein HU200_012277 [Digitaria exilis]|uniref:Uncharacterized protein n=1 Tax=Digitaria exilis TaxID=1010633 RepID=A0A835AH99_9POAL|nr:hypothetical protein HU200_055316 [Digitaria exilis]KAF8751044.1 hypothetical protein HU200_012277 [Digitaria exilis]
MRRNTLLALFIWAMVAAIFAVAMPAAARRDGIHPQGCRCCYFTRNGFWIQCGKACCGSDDENCCLGTH